MLNLITGQVSHCTHAKSIIEVTNPIKLQNLVHSSVCKIVHSHITPMEKSSITKSDFYNHSGTFESYYFQHFLAACHNCALKRLPISPIQQVHTFMEEVQSLMPHWIPCKPDNLVYATITEALSGEKADIESYLAKVKIDLCIGQPGYPSKITIAGDQQTYPLMKALQKQHPDHYSWLVVLHGDWHTLQLLAEMIRDMLWDGGLKQLSYECGYKKIPTQWQEIHLLILALHEALLQKAVLTYISMDEMEVYDSKKFWEWLESITCNTNKDDFGLAYSYILMLTLHITRQ